MKKILAVLIAALMIFSIILWMKALTPVVVTMTPVSPVSLMGCCRVSKAW